MAGLNLGASVAQARNDTVYVIDQRDVVARSGSACAGVPAFGPRPPRLPAPWLRSATRDLIPKEVCGT